MSPRRVYALILVFLLTVMGVYHQMSHVFSLGSPNKPSFKLHEVRSSPCVVQSKTLPTELTPPISRIPHVSFQPGPVALHIQRDPYLTLHSQEPFITTSFNTPMCNKKKYISFSLFSRTAISKPNRYTVGILENIWNSQHAYPGWYVRIYWDHRNFMSPLKEMLWTEFRKFEFVEVITPDDIPIMKQIQSMSHRFLVFDDKNVDIYIIRDVDTRFIQREVDAVMEWILSGQKFHIMRDDYDHTKPVMGGMWGGRNDVGNLTKNMTRLLIQHARNPNERKPFDKRGTDQEFLQKHMLEEMLQSVLQHDSFHCVKFRAQSFPSPRVGIRTIGSTVDANGIYERSAEERMRLWKRFYPSGNPVECRRQKEWYYG